MTDYQLIGLENFISKYIKNPFLKTKKRGAYEIQGIEERYIESLLDIDELTTIVHKKVGEKLTDEIAKKVVDRIMVGVSLGLENENSCDF